MNRSLSTFFLALGFLYSCRGSSPTADTETCREYPQAFEEDGLAFICELDQGATVTLRCAAGAVLRSWEYAGLSDFVREPEVPNRTRFRTRITTGGVTLAGFVQTVRSYDYDASGRLTQRTRTSGGAQGTFTLDESTYTVWDSSGRPVEGETRSGSESAPVALTYDDSRRRVDTSTGESTVLDAKGNLASEVEIFGLGENPFRVERSYLVTRTIRVCLP